MYRILCVSSLLLLSLSLLLLSIPSTSSSSSSSFSSSPAHKKEGVVHTYHRKESGSESGSGGVSVDAPLAFDINQAYAQLMYAYSAYCPEAVIKTWSCFFCTFNASTKDFKPYAIVENPATNTFVYVGSRGSVVEVVFRGTQSNSIVNWIEDLDFAHSTPYSGVPNAFVHSGFLDAYDVVKAKLAPVVQTLVTSVKATQVYFTGHSLGGALSTLCALDLGPTLKVPFSLYNFGSPRVGNQAFSDYFHSKVSTVYRVVNKADTVPHLPDLKMGYHHVAQEVWWSTSTSYKVCDGTGEDPSCSDSLLLYDVPDHLNYFQINLDQGGC